MDFKEKSDLVLGVTENIKEWMINQPKKRCGLIEGHDNYWEGKIEAIKKLLSRNIEVKGNIRQYVGFIQDIVDDKMTMTEVENYIKVLIRDHN